MSSADALRTLAQIFARPLAAEEIAALAGSDHVLSQALREDAARGGRTALSEALAEEFTRLFVGPVGHQPPLEGLMRGDDELLGPYAREVTRAYRDADLEPDPGSGLLPDHLGVELGFLAELVERDQSAEVARFVRGHLDTWVPAWVGRYSGVARMSFYRVAGALLLEALRDLREADQA